MCDIKSVHEEDTPQSTDKLGIVELIPKKRGKTVKYITAATGLLTTSVVIAIGATYQQDVFFPSASTETQKNKTHVMVCYGKAKKLTFSWLFTVALVLLGVEFGTLVDPLSRLAEECRHRHERYGGSWRKMIKACGILQCRILFMLLLTITLIIPFFVLDRLSIDRSHLVYVFTGVGIGPLMQLLDLNIESEVYLSTFLEEKGMNMANVLGWSYYFTNLKPAAEMFVRKTKLGHHAKLSLDKLLLLIPLDYSTTDDLQQIDSHVKLSPSEHSDEHSFHYSLYRLLTAGEQRDGYFAIHYVQQPLRTLRSMTLFERVETVNIKTFDGEVKLLYRTLSEILAINKDIEETCLLVPIKTKNLESLKNGGLVKSIMDAVNRACACEKKITCTICKRKAQDKPPKQAEQKRSINREVFRKHSNYSTTGSIFVDV